MAVMEFGLGALRRARGVLVVGDAGVGKSRLVAAIAGIGLGVLLIVVTAVISGVLNVFWRSLSTMKPWVRTAL